MSSLSKRLKLIYDQLLPTKPVWDLCCDHGYLGLYAYESERFTAVHFVDQVPEIIDRLEVTFKEKVMTAANNTSVNFYACAGEDLSRPISGSLVISGVGSYTIFQILKSLQEQSLLKAERLILCPQNDVVSLDELKKLPDFSYRQNLETLTVIEKDRLRQIYVLDLTSLHT